MANLSESRHKRTHQNAFSGGEQTMSMLDNSMATIAGSMARQLKAAKPSARVTFEVEIICPVCSRGFKQRRKWHIYCSSKCRKEAWLTRRDCKDTLADTGLETE